MYVAITLSSDVMPSICGAVTCDFTHDVVAAKHVATIITFGICIRYLEQLAISVSKGKILLNLLFLQFLLGTTTTVKRAARARKFLVRSRAI